MAKIWLVGDSITHQYGQYMKTQHPEHDVVVLGRGGERSSEGLVRITSYVTGTDPAAGAVADIAVLSWGTNDAITLIDPNDIHVDIHPTQTASNIELMCRALALAGCKPIVGRPIGLVPASVVPSSIPGGKTLLNFLHKKTDEQRDAIQQMCRTADIDHFPMPRRNTADFWADAFHPTFEKAEDIVAPEIWEQIERFCSAELA